MDPERTCDWRLCSEPVPDDTPWRTKHAGEVFFFDKHECRRKFEEENPPDTQ